MSTPRRPRHPPSRPRLEPLEPRQLLAVVAVTTTADDGPGSLRQAILDADAAPDPSNAITFNIPGGGVQTIAPASPLPAITSPISIDGYTQPGASANTLAVGDNA